MIDEFIKQPLIKELLSEDAAKKLALAAETISNLQRGLYKLAVSEDSAALNLLKIGTVFQIFFIDTIASGKKPEELSKDDWKNIAEKVNQYAVLEDGQNYSVFVFTQYAAYIDISAEVIRKNISEKNYASIKNLSETIRYNTESFRNKELTEPAYIEACIWVSLEAMMKLLSSSLTCFVGQEYAELVQAAAQLAFEYGRYVLFAKEQAILDRYIQNQYILDKQLEEDYELYLAEVREHADRFKKLIDEAFSSDIRESLIQSAALAREAGVKENEILSSVADVDDFFM